MLPDPARSNTDDLAEEARTEKLRAEVEAVGVAVGYRSFARQSVLNHVAEITDVLPGPLARESALQHALTLISAYADKGTTGESMREVFKGAIDGLREVGVM